MSLLSHFLGSLVLSILLFACATQYRSTLHQGNPQNLKTTTDNSRFSVNDPFESNDVMPEKIKQSKKRSPASATQAPIYFELQPTGRLPVPDIDIVELQKILKLSEGDIKKQSLALNEYIIRETFPRDYCNPLQRRNNAHLCNYVSQYSKPNPSNNTTSRERPVPIRPQHFAAQQRMDYNRLSNSLVKVPTQRLAEWVPLMLQHSACPRNLSAASIRFLEPMLPEPKGRYYIEKLYEHASACLKPSDEGYELTHFRLAILKTLWGQQKEAQLAIQRAALATRQSERSRVLYWAGMLQNDERIKQRYWNELIERHPLSFHALKAWKEQGQDPYQLFASRPGVNPDPMWELIADRNLQRAMAWTAALKYFGHQQATRQSVDHLLEKEAPNLAPAQILYLAALKANNENELNSMSYLTHLANRYPRVLNQQTLQLIFPRHYYDLFKRNAPDTDLSLVLGLAKQESAFNPMARSPANAKGLMQILPTTAQVLTKKRNNNLYAPEINTRIGSHFLAQLIQRFDSAELALAAYNAGPQRVEQWARRYRSTNLPLMLDLIPFRETRNYVSSVLRNNYWYSRLYQDPREWQERQVYKSRLVSSLISAHTEAAMRLAMGEDFGNNNQHN